MDAFGELLRHTPQFKGKGRLISRWLRTRKGERTRLLPGGLRLRLDMTIPYEATVWMGWEERQELLALQRLLGPGDSFVDCGANIGLWSLVAAPIVGAEGRVDAFEPNPEVAARLSEHAMQSPVIHVHAVALAEQTGELTFEAAAHHNLGRVSASGTVAVRATTLDMALERPPTGIKIDVEGYELEVLQGARRALEHRPWIVMEFNRGHVNAASLSAWPVHRLLSDLGYGAQTVHGESLPDGWAPARGYANVLYEA
jgi:FkbM family methyltransferase